MSFAAGSADSCLIVVWRVALVVVGVDAFSVFAVFAAARVCGWELCWSVAAVHLEFKVNLRGLLS